VKPPAWTVQVGAWGNEVVVGGASACHCYVMWHVTHVYGTNVNHLVPAAAGEVCAHR
jgi:hypothetical protein